MSTNKRLEAIVQHWSHLAQYYGGDSAKRYRGNLKRAATAARETASLFERFEGQSRQVVAKDIETLRTAAALLSQLSDDFEVAQRKADAVKKAAIKKREEEETSRIQEKTKELFGEQPDPEQVFSMARDLVEFSRTGVDQFAMTKGCDRGVLSGEHDTGSLDWDARHKNLARCLRSLATNAIETRYPARQVRDSRDTLWYHANWQDFLEWRKDRQTVRAMLTPPCGL